MINTSYNITNQIVFGAAAGLVSLAILRKIDKNINWLVFDKLGSYFSQSLQNEKPGLEERVRKIKAELTDEEAQVYDRYIHTPNIGNPNGCIQQYAEFLRNPIDKNTYWVCKRIAFSVLIGPIIEEMILRGALSYFFEDNLKFILFSSFLFGIMHCQTRNGWHRNFQVFHDLMLHGVSFSMIKIWGSLSASIAAHAMLNISSTISDFKAAKATIDLFQHPQIIRAIIKHRKSQ